MAAPDFLSQLPSFDELLENPRIQEAIDRLNKSSAATRVRGALSGLTAEVGRAAENLQGLAPAEWVERLVRRLDLSQPVAPSQVINATGDPFAPGCAPPLPPAAIEAMRAAAEAGGHGSPATAACKLLPGEAALLGVSYPIMLSATLEAIATDGRVVVARGDHHEAAPGVRLDALARRAGVALNEVGATDATTLEDYVAALKAGEGVAPVVLCRPRGGTQVDLSALASAAKQAGALLVVDVGAGRPTEATPFADSSPTAESALRAGADLVLLDTAGRLGGPVGGLLVGTAGAIERVAASPAFHAAAGDRTVAAAVAATLSLFEQPDTLRFTHPLYQLLDAPDANLRSRAERLAPQLAVGPGVAQSEAVDLEGSWGVRLRVDSAVTDRLAQGEPAIWGRADGESLVLDLRSVFARDDRALVEAIAPASDSPA